MTSRMKATMMTNLTSLMICLMKTVRVAALTGSNQDLKGKKIAISSTVIATLSPRRKMLRKTRKMILRLPTEILLETLSDLFLLQSSKTKKEEKAHRRS